MKENPNLMVELTDEDGNKEMCQELKRLEHKGIEYAVLCPSEIEDEKEVGVVIMQYMADGVSLQMVEDDALCEEVFNVFASSLDDEE